MAPRLGERVEWHQEDKRQRLAPRCAALCVLIQQMTPDKVVEEIKKHGGTIIKTRLCHENEAKLRQALESVQESEKTLANEPVGAGH